MRLMEACLTVLEREEEETSKQEAFEEVYRPAIPALFRIPDALARLRRQLVELTEPTPLTHFLPKLPEQVPDRALVARSAVSSTFVAALELARLSEMVLSEGSTFEQVAISAASAPSGSLKGETRSGAASSCST